MPKESSEERNYRLAYEFSGKIYDKFKGLVSSVVLFGSVAKRKAMESSDIDLVIIVDDTIAPIDNSFIRWYRSELAKLVHNDENGKKFHLNTVTLTTFWEHLMKGDPTVINVVRYGIAIIDAGFFFEPVKRLLATGRIRPTVESVYNAIGRTTSHVFRADQKELSAISDIYWAFVDSAHAALMANHVTPPSPEHVPSLLKQVFVKKKTIPSKYIRWYKEIFNLEKNIVHGNVLRLDKGVLDKHRERAEKFTKDMKKIIDKKYKIKI